MSTLSSRSLKNALDVLGVIDYPVKFVCLAIMSQFATQFPVVGFGNLRIVVIACPVSLDLQRLEIPGTDIVRVIFRLALARGNWGHRAPRTETVV